MIVRTNAWNLSVEQWSDVLLSGATPEGIADDLLKGQVQPWTTALLELTADSHTVLDLGSGKGNHSAALALRGKQPTLVDWSKDNVEFGARLFDVMGLTGRFVQADITRPLPFEDNSFDTVFSCGVFEYFGPETIRCVLHETIRVCSKRVIIMVPNALSLAYRIGKWYMEKRGKWSWGGEVPSYTLKPYFRDTGSCRTSEFSIGAKTAVDFLALLPMGKTIRHFCTRFLKVTDHPKATLFRQGYLLITVADKLQKS